MFRNAVLSYAIVACLSGQWCNGYGFPRKKIIIDTDIFSDVDDAGALLLANTHASIDIMAVNVDYPSSYGAFAVSAMLGHYGNGHVPVGLRRPFRDTAFFDDTEFAHGEYASKVAYNWRNQSSVPWGEAEKFWDPVELYRKTLSGEEDHSVTITSIGFLENLSALLNSPPDAYSSLNGHQLVQAKVKELVIMGGQYPSGSEFNFKNYSIEATAHVVSSWPGTMVFSGHELSDTVSTAARFSVEGPKCDPGRAAYEWYTGYNNTRPAWDPLTTLYTIEGLSSGIFEFANSGGHNHVHMNGSNTWLDGKPPYPQHYLKLAVSGQKAGDLLDQMFIDGARKSCRDG